MALNSYDNTNASTINLCVNTEIAKVKLPTYILKDIIFMILLIQKI